MARCLWLLMLVVLMPSVVAGETPFISDAEWDRGASVAGTRDADSAAADEGSARPIIALVLGLSFLIAISVGGVLLVRLAARRRVRTGSARHLHMIESLPLGHKRSLHLVRLGDQVLVVGSHEQGLTAVTSVPIATLPELLEAEARVEAAIAEPAVPPGGVPFAQAFAHAVQSVLGRERR